MEVIDALKILGVDEGAWRKGQHVDLRGFLRVPASRGIGLRAFRN